MEKETKQITVGAHSVELRTYLTGRESRDIQSAMLNNLEMKQKDGASEISGFKGEMLSLQQDKQITTVVVSMDDSKENILNRILDLPLEEYNVIIKEVEEVATGKKQASS